MAGGNSFSWVFKNFLFTFLMNNIQSKTNLITFSIFISESEMWPSILFQMDERETEVVGQPTQNYLLG